HGCLISRATGKPLRPHVRNCPGRPAHLDDLAWLRKRRGSEGGHGGHSPLSAAMRAGGLTLSSCSSIMGPVCRVLPRPTAARVVPTPRSYGMRLTLPALIGLLPPIG